MQYKVGDLVLRTYGENNLFIVHREQNALFSGFIGVTCIKSGERLQMNIEYLKKLITDKI